jgi:arabinose-5-phosphate isomerase
MEKNCETIMTIDPHVIEKTTLASSALSLMNENKISSIFVTNKQNNVLGILHIHDCLRAGVQ